MALYQLPLPIDSVNQPTSGGTYQERLVALLSQDLDFHDKDSSYASHNFHSFPAKFPPQLPRKFIYALTSPGDVVLDPMMGSGTTVLEAFLAKRHSIGVDIDPLALMIAKVKSVPISTQKVSQIGAKIVDRATFAVRKKHKELVMALERRYDSKTQEFMDYWFAPETQIELVALITEIEKIDDIALKSFFKLAFSAAIITKTGGVSLAFDLAHTRPHRAKVVMDQTGEILLGQDLAENPSRRVQLLTKTLRSPLSEFEKRLKSNLKDMLAFSPDGIQPHVTFGDAQSLPLGDSCVDLVVTSPPYASNAIDYMRAHKFSLAWMGYPIDDLGQKRKEYIGGEALTGIDFEALPKETNKVVTDLAERDERKSLVLHRYYSEMTRVLKEMFRVIKSGKAVIFVVGSSTMRGRDTETHACLAEIGESVGFQVPKIGVRNLDRNRRMMPAGSKLNLDSQIQQRMHQEYVIGFYKPKA